MCYRNSIVATKDELQAAFLADFMEPYDFEPVYHGNAFTYLAWPVITAEQPHRIQLFQWGLVPFWAKDDQAVKDIRNRTLNAVSETAFTKPAFRHAIKRNRCLVASTGFFEWHTACKKKIPTYISLRNRKVFALAGIYDVHTDERTGEVFQTFSILTCTANPLLARIHNSKSRMPVILHAHDHEDWLNPDLPRNNVEALMQPFPESEMKAWTIGPLVSSRTHDPNVPDVTNPHGYAEFCVEG